MSSVVFILGAGASRQCGGPLMGDFLDTASDLLLRGKIGDQSEAFKAVFNAIGGLQVVHSKAEMDLNNIESIFTALELGKVIKQFPGLKHDEVDGVIAALKTLIVETLEQTVLFPVKNNRIVAPAPYPQFADLITYLKTEAAPNRSCSVITFNYDLAADYALMGDGSGPAYGIGTPANKGSVPLLKLHGSLNWGIERKAGAPAEIKVYKLGNVHNQMMHDTAPVPLSVGSRIAKLLREKGHEVENEPVIVPPTWNKADYHRDLSEVWASAANHLSEAEYVFIMGYSLPETDSFFRHLYALGSAGSHGFKRIVVFDPDETGQVEARFGRLMGPGARDRFTYRKETFAEGITWIKELFGGKSKRVGFFNVSY